jgi:predicted AAA+ superfamily ATPase
MFKSRTLAKTILRAAETFPAIVVTGPRQSGKTTLLKMMFLKTHRFVSLENPDVRMRAIEDPVSFFERYPPPVIVDEIQYVPELLSYIKTKIDEKRKPGSWLLTGSQNFILMHGISQSLAGRTAVLSLMPFSISERLNNGDKTIEPSAWIKRITSLKASQNNTSITDIILRGSYPEIATRRRIDRQIWCSSYISTYIERDVRNLSNVGDLNQFEKFLRLCATRTGQILNLSEMARDIGISVPTAKRWLSMLETGYQVYLLYPYYRNIGKRLIKSPKLYFTDTALASYLLGIHDRETLLNSPNFGNLFETLVVTDVLKRFLHFGQMPAMYYLRTMDGLEVDLVLEIGQKLHLFEIKGSMTILPKHATSLIRLSHELGTMVSSASIISLSREDFPLVNKIFCYGWHNILAV